MKPESTPRQITLNEIVRILLMVGFLAGSLYVIGQLPWSRELTRANVERYQDWIQRWGGGEYAAFILIGSGMVAIGFPRVVLSVIAGAMFGWMIGGLLALICATIGAVTTFGYARMVGRAVIEKRIGGRLEQLDALIKTHGFMAVLLMRLCPVGNAFVTNTVSGVTGVTLSAFILASFIGMIPESMLYAMMGAGMVEETHFSLWLGAGMFACTSILFVWYFNRAGLMLKIQTIMREKPMLAEQAGTCRQTCE